jgi:hypothetical protein
VKIDLWAELKGIYTPSAREPELVKVPTLVYLAVDGVGDPATSSVFREAIGALYAMAYTAKFMLKKGSAIDFRVMPLSGLFHAQDPAVYLEDRRHEWTWTLMIPVPSVVTAAVVKKTRTEIERKKGPVPAIDLVRRQVVREGLSAQILHQGPYAAERPTIERLHAFIAQEGLTFAGSHHEIYLSDPNRTAAQKLRTIIRQPVKKAATKA